jgi:F0F1-type ATP synthase assembly protein I
MRTGGGPGRLRVRPSGGRSHSDEASRRSILGSYAAAGVQFGAVLLVFTGLGYWLDTRIDTLPLLTLLGAALGGVGGFLHLYRSLTALGRERPPGARAG